MVEVVLVGPTPALAVHVFVVATFALVVGVVSVPSCIEEWWKEVHGFLCKCTTNERSQDWHKGSIKSPSSYF
jgi:hypothetical protein